MSGIHVPDVLKSAIPQARGILYGLAKELEAELMQQCSVAETQPVPATHLVAGGRCGASRPCGVTSTDSTRPQHPWDILIHNCGNCGHFVADRCDIEHLLGVN